MATMLGKSGNSTPYYTFQVSINRILLINHKMMSGTEVHNHLKCRERERERERGYGWSLKQDQYTAGYRLQIKRNTQFTTAVSKI